MSHVSGIEGFEEFLSFEEFLEIMSFQEIQDYLVSLKGKGVINFEDFNDLIRRNREEWFNKDGALKSKDVLCGVLKTRFEVYFMLKTSDVYEEKITDHEDFRLPRRRIIQVPPDMVRKNTLDFERRFEQLKDIPTLESFIAKVIDLYSSFDAMGRFMNKKEQFNFLDALRSRTHEISEMPASPLQKQFKRFLDRWKHILFDEDGNDVLVSWMDRCVDKTIQNSDTDSVDLSGWGDTSGFKPPEDFKDSNK